VCASAARASNGLVLAVEDGYAADAADIFLRVDAVAAHNPASTFRNAHLSAMLDDAVLPIMGVLKDGADDGEAWALKVGYARDRVVSYQKIKACAMKFETPPASLRADLMSCEEHVMKGPQPSFAVAADYNSMKRTAWDAHLQFDRAPSLMDNTLASGISRAQIDALTGDKWDGADLDNAARDVKMGTERFIAFAFAPSDHEAMVAANATGSGVRGEDCSVVYPAYVTVHNSKGAIEHLPATANESQPNSVIVPCAASLICELHALSAKAGRNHVLIAHQA
jgi:hypothetical protein